MLKTIQTVSKEEVLKKLNNPGVQIVNVLGPEYRHLGMIKGSEWIPVSELDARTQELDKYSEIIVYCASRECSASRNAAEKLTDMGFNVKAYEGGLKEWTEAGLPTERL